jgi:glycerophosphoryl diester phosphodiesterase
MSAPTPVPYRPEIVGHRGAAGLEPENTLPAFRRAVQLGVEWVELDVRLTADDHPILLHDERLDRTTSATGLVSEVTLQQLRDLTPGGPQVPTLAEALAILGPDTRCLIELKRDDGREPELVRAAVTAVADAGLEARVRLISFQESLLVEARRQAPHLARGIIGGRDLELLFATAERQECIAIHPNQALLVDGLADRCARARLRLNAWTANDAPSLRRLAAFHVQEITTDFPDLAHQILVELGVRTRNRR